MGPAGVGKTALAEAFFAELTADGRASTEIIGVLSNPDIPLGAVSPLLVEMAPSTTQGGLIRQTVEAITADATSEPVVVFVDDAHLLDNASGTLVHQLALSRKAFIIATVRADLPVSDGVTALWKDLAAERIDLESLSPGETLLLAEAILGGSVDQKSADVVYQTSRGNPMFVQHLLTRGREEGALTLCRVDAPGGEGQQWIATDRMPLSSSLVEAIEHRLGELSSLDRELLELISIADSLGIVEIQAITGPEGEKRASALEDRGLIVAEYMHRRLEVRIAHPLYCEVIRARMSPSSDVRTRLQLVDAVMARGLRRRDDALRVAVWLLEAGASIDPAIGERAVQDARLRSGDDLAERIIAHMAESPHGLLQRARVPAGDQPHDGHQADP